MAANWHLEIIQNMSVTISNDNEDLINDERDLVNASRSVDQGLFGANNNPRKNGYCHG